MKIYKLSRNRQIRQQSAKTIMRGSWAWWSSIGRFFPGIKPTPICALQTRFGDPSAGDRPYCRIPHSSMRRVFFLGHTGHNCNTGEQFWCWAESVRFESVNGGA